MRMTLVLLLTFLILEGCVTTSPDSKFDGTWSFCTPQKVSDSAPPPERLMCVNEADLMKLKTVLDVCGAAQ